MIPGLSLTLTAISYVALGAIALGIVTWFIVRRQKQRFWMPVLRVIQLELTVLPKLRWTRPPLWPLCCFILGALSLGLFVFEPSETIVKGENLDLRHTHVFFDLSPSVSYQMSQTQYAGEAEKILQSLRDTAKVSFSFSSGPEIYGMDDLEQITTVIRGGGFHRAGLRLGTAIDEVLRRAPDVEHLVIVSDQDQASWEDFNWRYLAKKVQISWFPLQGTKSKHDNVFIDDLKPRDQSGVPQNLAWTVVLRRTGQGQALSGKLEVELEGRSLLNQDWQFGPEGKSLEMDILLPQELLQKSQQENLTLQWTLTASGVDDLLIDNVFRSSLRMRSERALLIARPRGEMFLEDSVFHLKSSLEVLGFRTQRIDQLPPEGLNWQAPALVVSEVAPETPRSSFCPTGLLERKRTLPIKEETQIWLLPGADLSDYGELCHCYAELLKFPEPVPNRPAYCDSIENRDQWVGVLQSLGAKQIGGSVESPVQSLAMHFRDSTLRLQLVGFTVPLNPMRGGVSFGQLPLMLQALLRFLPVGKEGSSAVGAWPRFEDIAMVYADPLREQSNVPLVESLLRPIAPESLPPQLGLQTQGLVRQASLANQEQDARPWIYLCLVLIGLALWLEVIGHGIARVFRGQQWVGRWFVVTLLAATSLPDASAQVRLNLLGYPELPRLQALRRDVAGRTSIEIEDKARQFSNYQKDLLLEPWLWSVSPQHLEGLSKKDWNDLMSWLQRGGFMIIENHRGGSSFKELVQSQIPQGQWKPIPPDHELMRSFHLLASLPQCREGVWEGFHFDQRIAIVLVPGDFLSLLYDERAQPACFGNFNREQALRIFINLLMVALATDYKKDQIHLPEILKRLR
jgi:hypothetical protein